MKDYKWLGIVIIIIILVIGAYWFGQNSNNQTSSANIPIANDTSAQQVSIPAAQQTGSTSPTQQVAGIALQKQCSSDARNFFYQWETTFYGKGMIDSGGQPSYLSHYNSSLNKCFVEISGLLYMHDVPMGYFSETFLYDVYGGNEIASMEVNSENNSFLCDFDSHDFGDTPDYCTSPAAFNNGINAYMSD
jgi:hypothetical protein